MEHAEPPASTLAQTSLGPVEYIDSGQGNRCSSSMVRLAGVIKVR